MPYIPLEKLLKNSGDSIYKLVVLASLRAFEIAEGKPALVEKASSDKPGSIALEEIAQGKIKLRLPGTKKA